MTSNMTSNMSSNMTSNMSSNMPSLMDMYAMMGITVNSSLGDVRKSYKNMALMCHPDRGGNVTDMHILKNAYDWIVHQLSHVSLETTKGTYEEREREFTEFMQSQTNTQIPSLNDIEIDALGIPSEFLLKIKTSIRTSVQEYSKNNTDDFYFNIAYREIMYKIIATNIDVYDYNEIETLVNTYLNNFNRITNEINNTTLHASIPGGYGDFMDTTPEPMDIPIKPENNFGSKELVLHETQNSRALVISKKNNTEYYATIPIPEKLEDYTQGNMCDYKVAYTTTIEESQKLLEKYQESTVNETRTYDAIREERNAFDESMKMVSREKVTLL